jgi:hypothetical protein
MSMAAGEYVSVHSQADAEKADLRLERREIRVDSKGEHRELAAIYVDRGLDPALAKQVAQQLMAHNALQAHARDELGITEVLRARPIQAGLTSALSFAVGAVLPLLISSLAPQCVRQGIYDRIRKGITAPSGCKNARAGPTIPSALLICPAPHLSPSTLLSPSIPDASRSRAIIVGRNSTLTFEREESRLTERLDYLARGSLPGH